MVPELNDQRGIDSVAGGGNDEESAVEGVFVRLWTRRPVSGRQVDVIDRLSTLASGDELADFEVKTWPDKVVLSEHTNRTDAVQAYETIAQWADEHDRSVSPPFERRTVTSLVGRTEEILTLPVFCLTVHGDQLRGAFPNQEGDRTWSVTDFLDEYGSTGDLDAVDAVPSSTGD